MHIRTWLAAVATGLVVSATWAGNAQAFDLTGTWEGKWSCKGFDGSKFKSANKESIMLITQAGDTVNVDVDGGEFHYNGRAIPDDAKPEKGEVVLAACPNDNLPGAGGEAETVRATVKTKLTTFKATFKAISIFDDDFPSVGTCKYTFKRIDAADPGVSPCFM